MLRDLVGFRPPSCASEVSLAFFHTLRRWLGLDPEPLSLEELRRRTEDLIDADDGNGLAALLRPQQDTGKRLIRSYESELRHVAPERRAAIGRSRAHQHAAHSSERSVAALERELHSGHVGCVCDSSRGG